jgi:hypothetical protein
MLCDAGTRFGALLVESASSSSAERCCIAISCHCDALSARFTRRYIPL